MTAVLELSNDTGATTKLFRVNRGTTLRLTLAAHLEHVRDITVSTNYPESEDVSFDRQARHELKLQSDVTNRYELRTDQLLNKAGLGYKQTCTVN